MNIGEKIAELRRQNKMTQKDLAEMINVSDKVISKWETGKSLPDVEAMMRIAKTFNISVSDLYDCIEKTDMKNVEDYNEERIWQYKKNSLISDFLLIASPSIYSLTMIQWTQFYDLRDNIKFFLTISSVVLFILAFAYQIISFVQLYSYSRQKYYRSEYKKVILKYTCLFIVIFFLLLVIYYVYGWYCRMILAGVFKPIN